MTFSGGDRDATVDRARRPVLRMVIADGQPLFARSLEMVLGDLVFGDTVLGGTVLGGTALGPSSNGRIEVVGTASTVGEVLRVVGDAEPDLVLIDLDLPPPGAIDLIRQSSDRYPEVRILTLSKEEDYDLAVDALAAGAEAYLSKAARPEQLLAPLLAVLQGWQVLSAPLVDHLVSRSRRPGSEIISTLSDDEVRLWRLVATGLEIAGIAEALYVSERTAKRLVAELREHLGVGNRIEMAALAGRSGLLDDEPVADPRGSRSALRSRRSPGPGA
jgi:DNA-binding NarL/FixJ family response regulator